MKTNGQRRGSVLMEFIIVFPIYLILFAGTMAVGDMLIHSNRLVSADRMAAFDVDGRPVSGWGLISSLVFHPASEIADDGSAQDTLSENTVAHYADATGPWSVCALASAHDSYKLLAGGTLGQLLAARMLVGGGGSDILDQFAGGVNMVSKDTNNGASFYTLKRRDHYTQRNERRKGKNKYIDEDSRNWRDRGNVSRLLRTQGRPGTENWRLEVAKEGWHTADTIHGSVRLSDSDAKGSNLPDYKRYGVFVELSE